MKKNDIHSIDRYVITGIFLSLFFYNPAKSEPTGHPIGFDYKNVPLKTALDSLIDAHRVAVVYQDRHLEGKQTSARCVDCTPEDALNILLSNQNLQWKKKGIQFIVVSTLHPKIKNEFVIKGIVRDGMTGEPIPYANVHIYNTHRGDITNSDGYFNIASKLDSCFLNVSYIGYEPVQIPFSFLDSGDLLRVVELLPKVLRAEGITVKVDDIEIFSQPLQTGQLTFSPRHIASLPKLGETDVFRSLQLLPGIHIGNIGSAGLYIRGGTPDQNLILLDGMSVYQTDHFYGFLSAINSEAIKDIQIYKGGIPAKYGGRTSSVIELTGKQGNTKKRSLSFYSNLLTVGLTYEEPLFGLGSLFLTYRGSYSHYYRTFLFDHIYNFLTKGEGQNSLSISTDSTDYSPKLSFYDLNGKVTFMPNDHNVISFSYFSGNDEISRIYNFPKNTNSYYLDALKDTTQWSNQSTSVKWSKIWGSTFYSYFLLSISKYNSNSYEKRLYEGEITKPDDNFINDNKLSDNSFQIDNEWFINTSHDLEFGFSQKQFNTHSENKAQDSEIKINSHDASLNSYYFQDHWKYNPVMEIIYGVRISNYSLSKELFWEPRFSFTYTLTDFLTLKGSSGRYTQFIHRFSNNFMIGGKKFVWLLSNNLLKPILSDQVNLGVQYDDKNMTSEIAIFLREGTHLADFSRIQLPSNAYDVNANETNFTLGTGISKGLELILQKKTGFIRGWSSYSFGETEHFFPNSSINHGMGFPAKHDRTHEIKSVMTSSYKNWDISLSWIFVSGSVYTPTGIEYYLPITGDSVGIPDSSISKNSERLPFIHKIDVSILKHFNLFSANWEIGLSIFNLFDRKNISHKKYIWVLIEEGENLKKEIITTNVEMLGFTPTFHIRLSM